MSEIEEMMEAIRAGLGQIAKLTAQSDQMNAQLKSLVGLAFERQSIAGPASRMDLDALLLSFATAREDHDVRRANELGPEVQRRLKRIYDLGWQHHRISPTALREIWDGNFDGNFHVV